MCNHFECNQKNGYTVNGYNYVTILPVTKKMVTLIMVTKHISMLLLTTNNDYQKILG